MNPRDLKYIFWLGSIKKMSKAVRLKDIPTVLKNNITPNIEAYRFTGFQDSKSQDIYEGHFFRIEKERDSGDDVNYVITTWISEWGMFATLLHDEYLQYQAKGADALDETMFWTYPLTDAKELTITGHIKTDSHKIVYPDIERMLDSISNDDFNNPFQIK